MFTVPSTVTGAAATGMTSPVFTVSGATGPDTNSKRGIISALTSGTASGVRYHTVSDPFDFTVWAPKVPKPLPQVNPVTLAYPAIPVNTHSVVTRKGVLCAANLSSKTSMFNTKMDIPAGSESFDAVNIAAALSVHIGLLWAKVAELQTNVASGST